MFSSPVPPYIDSTNLDSHPKFIQGKVLILNCPAMGIPFPNVTWQREREPIEAGGRVRLLLSSRQLEITGARQSDTARYTCVATNEAGQAKKDFDVNVLGKEYHFFEKLTMCIDYKAIM